MREEHKFKLSMAKMKFATFHSLTIVNLSLRFIKIRARTKHNFKGDSEQIKTKISMITSGVHIIYLSLSSLFHFLRFSPELGPYF